ncbi:hypothetical protein H5410_013694 [Solanum commersonii]|uniref:Uncharacterized protein n=1 Tax=Solanum commersonii TaxID=4109 RepID=A0A9J5ZNY1_SOLCO|nr:hypothetical protein H5410_013694 [Solanum commersonii]
MSTPTLMYHAPRFGLRPSIPTKIKQADATTLQHTAHPVLTINFPNHDPDPTIRPMVVSENAILEPARGTNSFRNKDY